MSESTLPTLVTIGQLTESLNISRQTVYAMIADGRLPQPLKFGSQAVRFDAGEVQVAIARARHVSVRAQRRSKQPRVRGAA
jgi:excisionase family DNA binding protein